MTPLPMALVETGARWGAARGYRFVEEQSEVFCSFAELAERAARYAAALRARGLKPGDRVALVLPTSPEFAFCFLGAMHAGMVPVPLYPPYNPGQLGFYLEHARHILRTSEARLLITTGRIRKILGSLLNAPLREIRTPDELGADGYEPESPKAEPDRPAFIQFTSGSTGRPKGVMLTHANIAANSEAIMKRGLRVSSDDVGCSWLPLYHDMGLIGFLLAPLTTGNEVVFMSPLSFLKRPIEWLRMISRHHATVSFAPNFAYGLCAARVRQRDLASLDLSSWRVAGCGAEPIQWETLERFSTTFASAGFDWKAFLLAYGLAESTLAVSFAHGAPRTDRVMLDDLTERGHARPAGEDAGASVTLISCGRPFDGHEVTVVDERGKTCPSRRVGEILIKGPSVMAGYVRDPGASRSALRDGCLHTGDLGYMANGELFVCGRIKDLIIVAGRNYSPSDVEWVIADIPGVRRGKVVVFGLQATPGEAEPAVERVVACVETRCPVTGREALAQRITSKVLEEIGLKLSDVVLLKPGSLPRTYSGKLQRNRARALYLEGRLDGRAEREGSLSLMLRLARSQWRFMTHRVGAVLKNN